MNTKENKYIVTWEEFDGLCTDLSNQILGSELFKDMKNIYAIPRGGLIIAVRLSHLLDLPLCFTYHEWKKTETLVVDDVSDTGEALSRFKDFKIATLHRKDGTKTEPDFCVKTINQWIVYPWEKGGVEDGS